MNSMRTARFVAEMMGGKVINGGGDVILIEIPVPGDEDLTLILSSGGWALEHYLQGTVVEMEEVFGRYEE